VDRYARLTRGGALPSLGTHGERRFGCFLSRRILNRRRLRFIGRQRWGHPRRADGAVVGIKRIRRRVRDFRLCPHPGLRSMSAAMAAYSCGSLPRRVRFLRPSRIWMIELDV
jgi:hypothetical protein